MTECKLLFRQALIDATIELADDLQDVKRIGYSAEHRKRMRSMGIAIGLSTRAKILIALIAAAILLTGCAVFREHITGLLLSFGDGFVNIEGEVNPNAPKEIEHAYVATYVPEGFTQVEREEDWDLVTTVWESSNGSRIELTQGVLAGVTFDADTKYAENSKIESNGMTIFTVLGNEYSIYFWSNELYAFKLRTNFNANEETIVEIINNLK